MPTFGRCTDLPEVMVIRMPSDLKEWLYDQARFEYISASDLTRRYILRGLREEAKKREKMAV